MRGVNYHHVHITSQSLPQCKKRIITNHGDKQKNQQKAQPTPRKKPCILCCRVVVESPQHHLQNNATINEPALTPTIHHA